MRNDAQDVSIAEGNELMTGPQRRLSDDRALPKGKFVDSGRLAENINE